MSSSRWLSLIVSLPGKNQALRMRVWRHIKAMGAVVLRDGAYLLPDKPELKKALQTISHEIIANDGVAHLLSFSSEDDNQQQSYITMFDRHEDYNELIKRVGEAKQAMDGQSETNARKQYAALTNELALIRRVDYFPGEAYDQASYVIQELDAAILQRYSPDEPSPIVQQITRLQIADYQGRCWATRKHMWVDRVASAWLIKCYIDNQATFIWLDKPEDCPDDTVGFDFDGAAFSHIGDKVSFEVLMHSFGLNEDPGLRKLAEVIHFLDVGGIPIAEAKGLEMILLGARETCGNDDALLEEMGKIFTYLVKAFVTEN